MKKRLISIVTMLAMLTSMLSVGITVSAEPAASDSVVFNKTLVKSTTAGIPDRLRLEAYTKGSTTASVDNVPTDIVLVLDQSGSMDESITGGTKLQVMKDAVDGFVKEVEKFNRDTDHPDKYRVAIVGFASPSGNGENTEILTVSGVDTVQKITYEPIDASELDINGTYYISTGDGYDSISYEDPLFADAGWYTSVGILGWGANEVNIQNTTIYERVVTPTDVPRTEPGVAYADLSDTDYFNALVDCTSTEIGADGTIYKAVNALDGEGATRVDLGMQIAQRIFEAQQAADADIYKTRKRIVMVLTDGVPTSSNTFDDTVANNAVAIAKALKDDKVHIFSTYLGTPDEKSASFLQALSSNYPLAETYDDIAPETKAADSYYKAHADASGITSFFGDIVYDITAHSALNEASVVTDTISKYFKLPSFVDGKYDPAQITVFTSDSIDGIDDEDGWKPEVSFPTAKVSIEGDKTIKVTGFNFGYHCVTTSPKDGEGGSNYGRKLVIYIPIVEDEADTFGGWLPTNDDAEILLTADAVTPEITAPSQHNDVTLKYDLVDTVRSYHIGGNATYTFRYDEDTMNSILSEMIPADYIPDGDNNIGVDMVYLLVDADDPLNPVATFSVPAGENPGVDILDISKWNVVGSSSKDITITSDNSAVAKYQLQCKLTSIKPEDLSATPPVVAPTLTEVSTLFVNVVNETYHIVGGTIDAGGDITVDPTDKGTLNPNGYREEVQDGGQSAEMTFKAKTGYEIAKIVKRTGNHESPLTTTETLYDINNPTSIEGLEGDTYTHQFTNVTVGMTIEVYTRPITLTLTTIHDKGAAIREGGTYTYHPTDEIDVYFTAHPGYKITEVYAGETQEAAENGGNIIGSLIQLDKDGYGNVIGGDVFVPRTQNNYVKVVSEPLEYTVTYKYYTKVSEGSYTEETSEVKDVAYGDPLPEPAEEIGAESGGYTLKGWFKTYTGKEFSGVTKLSTVTMSDSDLTFHAFWEKNPDIVIEPNPGISKQYVLRELDEFSNPKPATLTENETAKFVAVFQEQIVGRTEIEVTPGDANAFKEGSIKITLTDAQKEIWATKRAPIYIYEERGTQNTWIYDDTVYTLNFESYDSGENKYSYKVIKQGETDPTSLAFTNRKAPYLVRYNLNGGMLAGAGSRAPKVVEFEEKGLIPQEAPTKSNYTFIGWTYNTANVNGDSSYNALVANDETIREITLVAQYRYNGGGGGGGGASQYTLTYESNGGTKFSPEKYNSGKVVKLDKVPQKDGYIFDGWHLDKALGEDVKEVKMTKNITVYANWIEDNGTAGNGHETPDSLNGDDHFAYVIGYPDGTVRPNANITRAEVTAIFFRLLKDEVREANLTETNSFTDVRSDMWYNTAISTMTKLGIVKGRFKDAFVPDDNITRAEFATICARFDDSEFTAVDSFKDVAGHWAEADIHEAAAHGWIRGYEDSTFRPDQCITRAEAMTMINRVLNRVPEDKNGLLDDMIKWPDNKESDWYYLAVQEATNSHEFEKLNNIYEKWTKLTKGTDWKVYQ